MKNEIKRNPITILLLVLTTPVLLAMQIIYFGNVASGQAILNLGGMYGVYVGLVPIRLWRLATPTFVHIGWEHFFLNALTLYFVEQIAEQIWGHHKFSALYVLSEVAENASTLFLTPNVIATGASTSLFGVFAAIMVVGYLGRNPFLKELGYNYQLLTLINLLFNLFTPGVGIIEYIGGPVSGILCAIFLPTTVEEDIFKPWQRRLAAGACIILNPILILAVLT